MTALQRGLQSIMIGAAFAGLTGCKVGPHYVEPHPPLLAKSIGVDARIVRYLLDSDVVDDRLRPCVTLFEPGAGFREFSFMSRSVRGS